VYLAFLALFYSLARKRFGRTYSLLAVFMLATIPQVADYATIMYADLPFAALVTCGTMYMAQYIRSAQRADLMLASALFGISLWTKNEAAVFAGCFWAVLIVFFARTERHNKRNVAGELVTAFLLMAVIAAPWFVVRSSAAANSDLDMAKLTFGRLMQNVRDIPVFLDLFQQEVFGPKKWNIFWVMFFAALIWKRKELWKRENIYVMLFITLAFAGYFSAYMMMTGENLYFYVNTTISRFMLHFCGIALFLMANLVYGDVREIESFKDKG
jgi:4-amino-4-deoxy-L-arabinose transferase-like glycosyltransferase